MRLPVFQNLLHQEFHIVRWDSESQADIGSACSTRPNLVVDANDLTLHVEQRSAGIAMVYRGVGLNEFAQGVLHQNAGVQAPMQTTDYTGADAAPPIRAGCRSPAPDLRREAHRCCRL